MARQTPPAPTVRPAAARRRRGVEWPSVALCCGVYGGFLALTFWHAHLPAAVVVGAANVEWPAVLQSMRSHLAGFKIPKEIYLADSFPTTATNKVQRSVLKELIADSKLTRVV